MKSPFCVVAGSLLFAVALAHHAEANLIQNGNFTGVTYSGNQPMTTLYGMFGSYGGSTLQVTNWTTSGYNFVFAPGTADAGTSAGANAGKPNEAPGAYNAANGYGNTYLWGTNNGGTNAITAIPSGGNFIAGDGAFGVGDVKQTVTGLTIGNTYALSFYYAAAQQQGYTGDTTENWKVSWKGATTGVTTNFTTTTINLPAKGFSGWFQQTYNFLATDTSETLSFLAQGTPTGQPPFSLLGGVSLNVVPEFSNWMVFAGFGAACTAFEIFRRRRQRPSVVSAPMPVG